MFDKKKIYIKSFIKKIGLQLLKFFYKTAKPETFLISYDIYQDLTR